MITNKDEFQFTVGNDNTIYTVTPCNNDEHLITWEDSTGKIQKLRWGINSLVNNINDKNFKWNIYTKTIKLYKHILNIKS